MLISHKNKLITIDIPKTGTRSLRETLTELIHLDIVGSSQCELFNQHGTALECYNSLNTININFDDYFSFCVVRNPWDRYLSFFKYYKDKAYEYLNRETNEAWSNAEIAQGKLCAELFSAKNNYLILKNIIMNNRKQSDYYLDNNHKVMVSYVAEFANLTTEFDFLCSSIGISCTNLKHKNKSSSIVYKDIYNQELIDLVAKKEKHVIEMKNYNI